MSTVEKDFDRLALLDSGGWTQNNHYHDFLLRHVPQNCIHALEIGCGTGAFSRRLAQRAQRVTVIDLSSEMIRVARSRSSQLSNLDFEVADLMSRDFPAEHFDCIATIATLHHLPLRPALLSARSAARGPDAEERQDAGAAPLGDAGLAHVPSGRPRRGPEAALQECRAHDPLLEGGGCGGLAHARSGTSLCTRGHSGDEETYLQCHGTVI